jgi:ADP-ribosylglycohydrolase
MQSSRRLRYTWIRERPVGFAFASEDEVLRQAEATALITHNHPEGIKGAQVTALAAITDQVQRLLTPDLWRIIEAFDRKYAAVFQ